MLAVQSIAKRYASGAGELAILGDVNLTLDAGAAAVIVGPSGCGKSTLLNILGALEPPSAGRVLLDGVDPHSLSPAAQAEFRNRQVGYVFQEHHLLPQCSVLENVLLPTIPRGAAPADAARARELLASVGLTERCDHRPAELSGGERQRAALARALMNRPRLVLADEPTGNLDRAAAERIGDLLVDLPGAQGVTLVVVTHSAALAARFEREYELAGGRLTPRRGPAPS